MFRILAASVDKLLRATNKRGVVNSYPNSSRLSLFCSLFGRFTCLDAPAKERPVIGECWSIFGMMLKQYPAFMVIQDQHRYILFGHIGTRLLLALNSENRDPCGQERSSLPRRTSWPHIE